MTEPEPEPEAHVALENVRVAFGPRVVFEQLDCRFPRGRISVLMGGSGSGKSTILRVIGGLVRPVHGHVWVAGEDVTRLSERGLNRVRRRLGMLFQGSALFDSLSVAENVALPLRERRELSRQEIAAEVQRRLADVGLEDSGGLMPAQLSGGMQRRVGLARAIVSSPEILLCDEPFSGLDPLNVRRIEALLVDLNRRYGHTLIVTSHHVPSTRRMAQQVVFVREGRAVAGSPAELERGPDPGIAEFFRAEEAESVTLPPASVGRA
jgi:phospholipid/cholesterol/gamma-HCH transport system ATP-binding protein